MRYQELRKARTTLEHAIEYLTRTPYDPFAYRILEHALAAVRDELKRPERYDLEGNLRRLPFYDSALRGTYRKAAQ